MSRSLTGMSPSLTSYTVNPRFLPIDVSLRWDSREIAVSDPVATF